MQQKQFCLINILIAFLLFFVAWTPSTYGSNTDLQASRETDHVFSRKVQYGFTLQNKSNRVLEKAEFWTYAPVKETSNQRTIKLEASHPYQLIEDELGNQVLYFQFKNLPPYATKIIVVKAFLELNDMPAAFPVKDGQPFLKAEKHIESDNNDISVFAKRFRSDDPADTANKIFGWVSDNLQYTGYLRDNYGALYAFKNRKGDCTEFMSLFVALSRANNVPARGIGGYVTDKNAVLKPYEYHNWAEFHDDGAWNIADPQNRSFMKNSSHYIAMRVIGDTKDNPMGDFNRFRYAGDGLKVRMNK